MCFRLAKFWQVVPLFVVVGKDGKIAEYHAGLYDVKATEGLAELEAVVAKAQLAK